MTPHNIHMMPVLTYDGGVRYVGLGSTNSAYAAGGIISAAVPPLAPVVAAIFTLNKGLNALGVGGGGTKYVIDRLWPQLEAKAKQEGLPMTRPEFDAYFAVTYGTPTSAQTQTYDKWIVKMNALHAPKPQTQPQTQAPTGSNNTPVKFASIPVIGPLITKYNSLDQEGRTIIAVTGALGGLVILTAIVQAIKEKRK